jgi:hypothetical protein
MIYKEMGYYFLYCDVCGEEESGMFDSFYDAVEYKKINGWKSQKRNSEWEDVCPECQED